jgi:hypothetical protein
VMAWLLRHGLKRAAIHWLAAIAFGSLLGAALFALGGEIHANELTQHGGGDDLLLTAIACFGFLAVLINRELPLRHRWWGYALAAALILTIAFARLYLGAQDLGSLLGVLSLGVAWVALLGIGYRNHPAERLAPLKLSLMSMMVVALTMAWHAPRQFDQDMKRYAYAAESTVISRQQWLTGAVALPAYRADLRGSRQQPLNIQYNGPLDELAGILSKAGWQRPPEVTLTSWLLWLNPDTPLSQMPILPQVHDGRYHELLLTHELDGALLALRLWRSQYRIGTTRGVLWLGSVSEMQAETRSGLTVPRTQTNYEVAKQALLAELAGVPALQRHDTAAGPLQLTLSAGPDS